MKNYYTKEELERIFRMINKKCDLLARGTLWLNKEEIKLLNNLSRREPAVFDTLKNCIDEKFYLEQHDFIKFFYQEKPKKTNLK